MLNHGRRSGEGSEENNQQQFYKATSIMVWQFTRLIAHRGAGIFAPENTIAAISHGLSEGYRAVEFDVMLSKDLIPVLMHDEYTGRTVKSPIKGIGDHLAEELLALDAGSWFDASKYNHVRVPLFADVLSFCQSNNIWMNIEIKPYPGVETETGTIVARQTKDFFAAFPSLPSNDLPLFSSFSYESLVAAKEAAPLFKRGYLIDNLLNVPDWKERCRVLEAYSVHVNHKHLTASLAQEIKAEGLGLFCYTVNDVDRAREIISWGVDSFCTDRLDLFKGFQF